MRLFYYGKDGGYESTVWGFWLVEIKSLFSIVLLRFEGSSREAFHSHAFNAVSWLLSGRLDEHVRESEDREWATWYLPSIFPIWTPRSRCHKVDSHGHSLVLSFRGPWADTWQEYLPSQNRVVTLASGRREL